ncbi:hypothetical protein LOD99_12971 [Oopsacas minuta]|uniref:Uncharacterized protein n=1 Tax=Oopsacas minuta TaxID=111878 RepID=A0AAV7JAD9_9METZ|nr:hypothetical protein LOD99_12971 [Oopsacas minuta]
MEYLNVTKSCADARNTVIYTPETIEKYGILLLTYDNTDPNSTQWLTNLDSFKVTKITYTCLEKIFKLLDLTDEDKSFILDVRRKENKRVSTAKRRRTIRQITQSVEVLKKIKSDLEMEKVLLLVDIEIYKISC